jgi:hypothetical protein
VRAIRSPLVAWFLLCTPACSWITVARPPQGPVAPEQTLSCTTSVAAPVVDTVLGVAGIGVGGAALVSGIAASSCSDVSCVLVLPWSVVVATAGALVMGLGVMEAFSAADGYTKTAECRDLQQSQLACVSGVEASCLQLKNRGAAP